MKKINIPKEIIIIIFIFTFIGIGIYVYFTSQYRWIPITEFSKCPIEYGKLVCVKEKPRIPFFNPNEIDLENIQVVVPKSDGVDIYQVNDSLKARDVQVLTLMYHDCTLEKKMNDLTLKWCCDSDCYDAMMITPSDKVTVGLTNNTFNETGINYYDY